jgi:hypothetical protein
MALPVGVSGRDPAHRPHGAGFQGRVLSGTDDKSITTQEADGVALAAIQGLNQKVDSENATLRSENAELRLRLEKLEQRMNGVSDQ